jgi:hypothetical protein
LWGDEVFETPFTSEERHMSQERSSAISTCLSSPSPRRTKRTKHLASAVAAALIGLGAPTANAVPVYYDTGIRIPVPASPDNTNPGGSFTSYDIMWVDNGLVYLADRSNASVDIFSAATNTFVGRIGGTGHVFVGQNPPPPAAPVTAQSGPDGLTVGNTAASGHTLFVGDGNSTLKTFNLNAGGALVATISTDPASTANPPTFAPAKRVDEMAFDPVHNTILVANNAATPAPFTTLINTATNAIVPGSKVSFPGADGIEQSVFDPVTQKFYLNVDSANSGSVVRIDPTTGLVEKTYDLAALGATTPCAPSGLAVDQGGKLMVGCGAGGQTLFLDPLANGGNGAILAKVPLSGEDMVWYDPIRKLFFLTARNFPDGCTASAAPPTANACTPELGIVDDLGNLLQTLATSFGAHSIAVDPVTGEAFMPFGGFGPGGAPNLAVTACPLGCVAVFALVPEPGTLALLSVGLVLVGGWGWRRRGAPLAT